MNLSALPSPIHAREADEPALPVSQAIYGALLRTVFPCHGLFSLGSARTSAGKAHNGPDRNGGTYNQTDLDHKRAGSPLLRRGNHRSSRTGSSDAHTLLIRRRCRAYWSRSSVILLLLCALRSTRWWTAARGRSSFGQRYRVSSIGILRSRLRGRRPGCRLRWGCLLRRCWLLRKRHRRCSVWQNYKNCKTNCDPAS